MIDCHCHLADERLFPHLNEVLARSNAHGIRHFIFGGVSPDEWERQKQIVARLPKGFSARTCFGLHPVWVAGTNDSACEQAFKLLETNIAGADAIGETGLDFRKEWATPAAKGRQQRWLRAHLDLAKTVHKPLVLHVVHAHEAALKICREHAGPAAGSSRGMVHGFTGSREIARKWLDLGYHISLGTRILYEKNQKLKDLAAWLPLDRLLVESDAPDQRPPGHPDPLNEPWTSIQVIAMIAAAKHMDAEALEAQLLANVKVLFGREKGS